MLKRCVLLAMICSSVLAAQPDSAPKLPGAHLRCTCGEPTAAEQYVLQLINRARIDPAAEGKRLNVDLTEGLAPAEKLRLRSRPPLAMNEKLLTIARAHSKDMYARAYFEHISPDGKTFVQRVKDSGYSYASIAENLAAATKYTPGELHDMLVIDADTEDRGHRKNLFELHADKDVKPLREAGIGIFSSDMKNSDGVTILLTEDFGVAGVLAKPLLTGVVYADKNGNGFYDPGEGLAGVTVKLDDNSAFAITNAAGGWAIPVSPGRVTVTVSGGAFEGTASASVKVSRDNIELDFISGKAEPIVNFGQGEDLRAGRPRYEK